MLIAKPFGVGAHHSFGNVAQMPGNLGGIQRPPALAAI